MAKVVVITGASAGVGRAAARAFASAGFDVGLIARHTGRLEATAKEVRERGRRAVVASVDVADAGAVDAAARRIEAELGPIAIWVNNAMATVFAPVEEVTAEELLRGTQVTYLGQVHGTMAALRCMRPRRAGTIVNIGSALCYRSVPLQAVYCGAKSAVRGFTDSLRSELLHDRAGIHVTMVHLPAVNTPQFGWALNKLGRRAQPVAPVYQPEVAARAIVFAATRKRREVWVGMPTVIAIMANRIAPGFADRYLSTRGYEGQMTSAPTDPHAPVNLFETVPGDAIAAHGRFGAKARRTSWRWPSNITLASSLPQLAQAPWPCTFSPNDLKGEPARSACVRRPLPSAPTSTGSGIRHWNATVTSPSGAFSIRFREAVKLPRLRGVLREMVVPVLPWPPRSLLRRPWANGSRGRNAAAPGYTTPR